MTGSGGKPGSKTGRGGKQRAAMSDDDHTVWEHTVRSLVPLRIKKPRVHAAISDDDPLVLFTAKPAPSHSKRHEHPPHTDHGHSHGHAAKPARVPRAAPDLQQFDTKRARRLKSGRIEIDARLDLHGMKQVEAHAALRRFLLSCHGNGLRTVLVITGKGGSAGEGRRGARREHDDMWGRPAERGVLKRNVPRWLAEPDLRRVVVSFTEAAVRHGGDGAIYVHLRSASKVGGHE